MLAHNPFEKRLDRKPPGDGVVNRRNGCGPTVAAQRLRSGGLNYGQKELYFKLLKRADLYVKLMTFDSP
ncbi:MAG: hypothetical protein PHH67_05335 [Methanosarcina sp.]|jgi:hypothetical protein|nr:hypothetical protein [Methanosarcina sp.]MDD2613925.1 hypothetical protein [Methanosarcina sp.]MDD4305921.1 hypothetical protein [Methanosarcina sp.]MDD4619982.1 hypothetical protein [Methanosarcina sp.]